MILVRKIFNILITLCYFGHKSLKDNILFISKFDDNVWCKFQDLSYIIKYHKQLFNKII